MAQIQFSLIKKIKTGRPEHLLPSTPLRPITSHFFLKNHMILGRYEEPVKDLYCESKEEEVMGSFLALTTGPIPEPSKYP